MTTGKHGLSGGGCGGGAKEEEEEAAELLTVLRDVRYLRLGEKSFITRGQTFSVSRKLNSVC